MSLSLKIICASYVSLSLKIICMFYVSLVLKIICVGCVVIAENYMRGQFVVIA